jgi:hypothetical protein
MASDAYKDKDENDKNAREKTFSFSIGLPQFNGQVLSITEFLKAAFLLENI